MTFSQNMNHVYSVTKGWRESTTKGKKTSLNSPDWFTHISLNDSYEILIVNQDDIPRWKLLISVQSLQPDESLDWHRHGNTGGLRADSEVEKVLRVVHSFIKSNSTLKIALLFKIHSTHGKRAFWIWEWKLAVYKWLELLNFQQKLLQLHNWYKRVDCIWT